MKTTDETKRQRKVDASTHIGTFVTVFCATAVILKNSYAANNVTLFDSLFGREQTWSDVTFYWLKRVFYIGSLNDFGKMLVRAIFSSFAKDGIISIWSPKTYTNKVPIKLTEKVMGKAFDPTWIPKSDRDRHIELKLGKPCSQNIFYGQIKPILNLVIFLCGKVNLLLIAFTEIANQVTNFLVTTSLGMISFSIRSIITALSLLLLVPIHIGQTVLRLIRWGHNLTMTCLKTTSQMVNDIGMLNVDLIKEAYVYEAGEKMEEMQEQQKFVRKSMMNMMTPSFQGSMGSSLKPSTGASLISGGSQQGIDRARSYVPSSDATSD